MMTSSLVLVLVVLVSVLLPTNAQFPPYQCTPNYCSQATGYDRGHVIGCKYWCYIDTDPRDGVVTCKEFVTAYNGWKGPEAPGCDRECYVTIHRQIIPEACDSELDASYTIYSMLDGDPTDISPLDVDLACEQVKMFQPPPNDEILPESFMAWWEMLYEEIKDDTCPNPIPRRR